MREPEGDWWLFEDGKSLAVGQCFELLRRLIGGAVQRSYVFRLNTA
jgi:hypothetical protein